MKTPRAIHVITGLDGGGAERFLASLLPLLADDPADTAVLTIQGPGVVQPALAKAGIAVRNMGARRGLPPSPLAWLAARRWARARRPEVVCGWMYHGNLAAHGLRRVAGKAVGLVWGIHQTLAALDDERWLTRRVIHWCRRHSGEVDRIVYVSRRGREQHAALGFADDHAEVIPNGFDLGHFRPDSPDPGDSPDARAAHAASVAANDGTADSTRGARGAFRRAVRRELGVAEDTPLILRVARVDPMKDHPLLLTAFEKIAAARPDATLVLAGAGVEADAPAFRAWRAGHPEAAARVRWLGWREDVGRLAAAADVAVSSSAMKEAFPLVLGEAMACATPCVTTDVGDAAWIVGDTGRVVPPGSADAMADAVLDILRLPPAERRALGLAARARIGENFSLAAAAERYRRVLSEAADCAKRRAGV